jgi:hypothetical protein
VKDKLQRLVRRFSCFVQGHPCEATGRRGYALCEWRCQRCGGVFISHSDYGRALLPATPDSDEMLIRHMDAIRADACTPNVPAQGREAYPDAGCLAVWSCPWCGCDETWFDRTVSYLPDGTEDGMKTRCVKCGRETDDMPNNALHVQPGRESGGL